jgi:hypothetical protein
MKRVATKRMMWKARPRQEYWKNKNPQHRQNPKLAGPVSHQEVLQPIGKMNLGIFLIRTARKNSMFEISLSICITYSQYDITAILGKIKLSLFYSEQRQKLIVYIYEVLVFRSHKSSYCILMFLEKSRTRRPPTTRT